jgi:hypothetical protein
MAVPQSGAGTQTTPAPTTTSTTTPSTTARSTDAKGGSNKAVAAKEKQVSIQKAQKAARWSLLVALVALIVVLPIVLGLIEALLKWSLAGWSTFAFYRWINGAVMGVDKRVSTSKTVMVVWTYSLASVLLAIVIAKLFGHPQGFNTLKKSGLQTEYAVLIGGPIGAAILAKGIVNDQVSKGQSKPKKEDTEKAKPADLISNDAGETDLGDLQYVLFNTVALTFLFGQYLSNPLLGLPDIPNVLVGLTSVSAVGYVGKKALPSAQRAITKVSSDPSPVTSTSWNGGQTVRFTVLGTGLVNADKSAPTEVRFEGDNGQQDGSNVVASITDEGTTLEFNLTNALPQGTYALQVITKEGNKITKADALTVT